MKVLASLSASAAILVASLGPVAAEEATYDPTARHVAITQLPNPFLDQSFVDNLTSGLSTMVVASAESKIGSGDRATEGRLRIRYDLWDELFIVDSVGFGDNGNRRFEDQRELEDWWRKRSLSLGPLERPPRTVRVRLVVLPFSASEGNDARLWFSRSVRRAGTNVGRSSEELGTLLERVMATAIRRQRLLTFDRTVTVTGTSDSR